MSSANPAKVIITGSDHVDGKILMVLGTMATCNRSEADAGARLIVTGWNGLDSRTSVAVAFTAPSVTLTIAAESETPALALDTDRTVTMLEGRNVAPAALKRASELLAEHAMFKLSDPRAWALGKAATCT